ncbi:PAS domain S-box protein [uncultured Methanoregula sp.]|uniref:PAS domain S-box protein n=1 Tax=uncultured Methanoregula sp. TaxID=1005933 RepID=UPI002AAB7AA7|nr:PAS domain S-box protein [uncultured Methanoregula sp.]
MALSREITTQIRELLEKNPQGLSITDIVRSTKINRNTAGRYLDSMLVSGQVEMRQFGMAKIYSVSERLPVSSVLSISSECVMQLDSSLRIIYLNAPFEHLLGVLGGELLGKNIEYTVIPHVLDKAFPRVLSHLREGILGDQYRGELEIPHLGRIFQCRVVPIVTAGGQKGVSMLLEDITSRKHDEEQLRRSEIRYRVLAEASRDLIFMIDRNDRIEFVNSFAAAFVGKRADELIGKPRSSVFPEDITRHQQDELERIFNTGMMLRSEGPLYKDNTLHWFDHYLVPLTDKDGCVQSVLGISRDITERKRAEEELFDSRQMLQLVLDTIPVRVFWKDRNSVFLGCNRSLALDAGYKEPIQLIGKTDYDHASAATADHYRADDRAVIETGRPKLNFEEIQIRPDGSQAWLLTSKVPLSNKAGNIIGVLGTYDDITERKRVVEALSESEERYRTVFENTGTATALVEENTIIRLVNAEFERLSGYKKEEIEGKKSWIEFVEKEDLETMIAQHNLRRQSRQDALEHYEFRFITKSGNIRIIFLTVDMIPGTTQSVTSLLDITERKRAENEFLLQEQQYRFIVNNSLDIITRQTPTCVCTYVSPSVTAILGYSVEESLGISLLALVHPDDIARIQKDLQDIVTNKSDLPASTFRFRHKDGRYLWFESMNNVIRDEQTGEIRELLSISRNITDRIQSEEKAQHRDQVLRAFGAASGFLLTGRIRDPYPRVLAIMGEALGADVAYIYRDIQDPVNGTRVTERKFRWTRDPAQDPGAGMECRTAFPGQWSKRLASGTWIAGPRARFSPPEQEEMEKTGVQSIIVVPIHVNGVYWGLIGCSDLHEEHDWADVEIEILVTLAATIGLILERQNPEGLT